MIIVVLKVILYLFMVGITVITGLHVLYMHKTKDYSPYNIQFNLLMVVTFCMLLIIITL